MLANFLDKSKPINFIVLLGLFLLAFIGISYSFLKEDSLSLISLVYNFVLLVSFSVLFFLFNFIVSKNKLTYDNSYAYFVFTLVIICWLPFVFTLNKTTCFLVYLLFVRKIYSLQNGKNILKKLFDAGFWLGIFLILEPNGVLFLGLIYVAIFLHLKLSYHTILAPLFGCIAPLIVYSSYIFWSKDLSILKTIFNPEFAYDFLSYENTKQIWFILFFSIILILSTLLKSSKALSVNNTFKQSWILLIANTIFCLFFILFYNNKNYSEFLYLFYPGAIIIANGIELLKNKIIKNVVLYLLVIVVTIYFVL